MDAADRDRSRGHLRVYLGSAPGVGKTYAMLDEARRRRDRGTDVVVGVVDAHDRAKTIELLDGLEAVPVRVIRTAPGRQVIDLDVPAVRERRPAVVLVDDLGHTNAPGGAHAKRWQDVDAILADGIDVITTLNIDQLESVTDVAEGLTGRRQPHTVPDAFVRQADQIELVDMSPEALRRRVAHGNVFVAGEVSAEMARYFNLENLAALRELALLWVADRVDESLQQHLDDAGIQHPVDTRERVVVALTGNPSGDLLIRRAARIAQRTRGDLIGVHVVSGSQEDTAPERSEANATQLDEHRRLLLDLGGEYHEVAGTDVGRTLVSYAMSERATQLVIGATQRSRVDELTRGSVINVVLREAGPIDVHVIGSGAPAASSERPQSLTSRRRLPHLSRRRQIGGWLVVLFLLPLTTLLLLPFDQLELATQMLVYLLVVMFAAVVGGIRPAIAAAVGSAIALNFLLTLPQGVFHIASAQELIAVVAFLTVGAVVSALVSMLSRSSVEANQSRAEAEALARIAGGMAGGEDGLQEMVSSLLATFGMARVALLVPDDDQGWRPLVTAEHTGAEPLRSPDGFPSFPLVEGGVLVYEGPTLTADDRRVLRAFVTQLDAGLERRRLEKQAAEASALAQADRLRTAILRAVSHDLRTPLASIKASATSLLQDDIVWPEDARHEFLETIDEETDRLNVLVGNLLDMSRIETGALEVALRPVGLDDVVPQALYSLSGPQPDVDVELPETVPPVLADPALLERVVANLTANALRHAPSDARVRIEAGEVGDHVDLRIVDRGRGVPEADRERLFEPFQRLGDQPKGTGVGLGLAVARGFVDAMHGELALEDTPGGGLTAVVSLPKAS